MSEFDFEHTVQRDITPENSLAILLELGKHWPEGLLYDDRRGIASLLAESDSLKSLLTFDYSEGGFLTLVIYRSPADEKMWEELGCVDETRDSAVLLYFTEESVECVTGEDMAEVMSEVMRYGLKPVVNEEFESFRARHQVSLPLSDWPKRKGSKD